MNETFWYGSRGDDIYFLVTSYITYAPMMQFWGKTDFWFSFKREVNDRFLNVPPRRRLNENDKTLAAWDVPSFYEFLALLIILYNKQNTNNISACGSRYVCVWVGWWMDRCTCVSSYFTLCHSGTTKARAHIATDTRVCEIFFSRYNSSDKTKKNVIVCLTS